MYTRYFIFHMFLIIFNKMQDLEIKISSSIKCQGTAGLVSSGAQEGRAAGVWTAERVSASLHFIIWMKHREFWDQILQITRFLSVSVIAYKVMGNTLPVRLQERCSGRDDCKHDDAQTVWTPSYVLNSNR